MRIAMRVNEIFHSIQGESSHAGRPCVFVRLTGCNLRCVWCDTAYAFHEGREMSVEEILRAVAGYRCGLVEVTGGEPLLQPGAIDLMRELLAAGYEVLLETGGSLPIDPVPEGVKRIVDVKCPASGEVAKNRWENLEALRAGDELKFVIAGREDYVFARDLVRERGITARVPVLFSAVREAIDPGALADWVLQDRLPVRVQIQLHKVLWPGVVRGV